jgi:hypothetical protein
VTIPIASCSPEELGLQIRVALQSCLGFRPISNFRERKQRQTKACVDPLTGNNKLVAFP